VNVFLKKGGFNNQPLFVDSVKVQNMFNLISVFSGVSGGPSALVDLEDDTTGVLPIIHGGTGLNAVGVSGTVLVSNGSGLSYQFFADIVSGIDVTLGVADANKLIKTDSVGLLDNSFVRKNPLYIYGAAGVFTESAGIPTAIGAFAYDTTFLVNARVLKVELTTILECTGSDAAQIRLYDLNTLSYVNLIGASPVMDTTNPTPALVGSDDLQLSLVSGHLYEIRLSTAATSAVICKMARLTIIYNN
jgi:hypothetical protein